MAELKPINVERLRQTFDDDAVLAELYAMYVEDTGRRLADLRLAINTGELDRVCREGHTLKGSSANIGAVTMREVAAELETADVSDGGAAASELVGTLEREFARVERFVNEFIARAQSLT
jgi:HPt (histidine-containing phosphotransfer) domain-containing protein